MVDISKFNLGETVGVCPRCNSNLILRKGKFGLFIGCSNYPKCRKTFNIDDFRVSDEAQILKKLEQSEDYESIIKLRDNTNDESVLNKIDAKLIEKGYCECGEKISCLRIYRTTPDYPVYLKEYRCPKCGNFITEEIPRQDFIKFVRMGTLGNSDDGYITGGYWI